MSSTECLSALCLHQIPGAQDFHINSQTLRDKMAIEIHKINVAGSLQKLAIRRTASAL